MKNIEERYKNDAEMLSMAIVWWNNIVNQIQDDDSRVTCETRNTTFMVMDLYRLKVKRYFLKAGICIEIDTTDDIPVEFTSRMLERIYYTNSISNPPKCSTSVKIDDKNKLLKWKLILEKIEKKKIKGVFPWI